MLTKEEIQEFKRLVKEIYGRELTDTEAEDQGGRLITAFELIIKNRKNEEEKTNLQKLFIEAMEEIKEEQKSKNLKSNLKR